MSDNRNKLRDIGVKIKEVAKDIFYPYKETFEGMRDVWLRVIKKKEDKLKIPDLKTIPLPPSKEEPTKLIDARAKGFLGYPLLKNDLKKISFALSEMKKSSPSFTDIILDDDRYSMIFDRYPRIGTDGKLRERYEVVIAINDTMVFCSQVDDNGKDPTEILYNTLLKNSLQFNLERKKS